MNLPQLSTQPNERRCDTMHEEHVLGISACCPVSDNPAPGSTVKISYTPGVHLLEVEDLKAYINSYIGGRGDVRSMEGMIQNIAKDCSDVLGVPVQVTANLLIFPDQKMNLTCIHG